MGFPTTILNVYFILTVDKCPKEIPLGATLRGILSFSSYTIRHLVPHLHWTLVLDFVLFSTLLVEVISMCVIDDRHREIFYRDLTYGFRA